MTVTEYKLANTCYILSTGVKWDDFNGFKKYMSDKTRTRDNTTYVAPGRVVSTSNHRIAFFNVCPWALHIGKAVVSFPSPGDVIRYIGTMRLSGNFTKTVRFC